MDTHAEREAALRENWLAPIGVGIIISIVLGAVSIISTSVRDHEELKTQREKIQDILETVHTNHGILTELQKNDAIQDHRLTNLEKKFD